jgi:hypothetical protein
MKIRSEDPATGYTVTVFTDPSTALDPQDAALTV